MHSINPTTGKKSIFLFLICRKNTSSYLSQKST